MEKASDAVFTAPIFLGMVIFFGHKQMGHSQSGNSAFGVLVAGGTRFWAVVAGMGGDDL